MKSDCQFPRELKALFRSAIADYLEVVKVQQDALMNPDSLYLLKGHESYAGLKRMIGNDPELASKFLDKPGGSDRETDEFATRLDFEVGRYIAFAAKRQVELGRLDLIDTDFEQRWNEICDFALRETLEWRFVARIKPLIILGNITIELVERVRIRALVENEIEKSKDEDLFFDPARYGVEVIYPQGPRQSFVWPDVARGPLDTVLTALRLYKGEAVWYDCVIVSSNSPFNNSSFGMSGGRWTPFQWTGHRVDPYCNRDKTCKLEPRDKENLAVLCKAISKSVHNLEDMRRSLELYNEAFEQSNRAASLLRIWGAIEAAFVASGTRRIAETAATALSELLEPAGQVRDDTKRRLRESYRRRSQVVHGEFQEEGSGIMSSCAFAAECYRRAILTRLRAEGLG